MTASQNTSATNGPLITPDKLPPAFAREVAKARAVITWERVWPRIVPPATVTALFLSASFAGVWGLASPAGRIAGVLGFAFALAASPFRYNTGSPIVTRKEALRRLDKNVGDPAINPAKIIGDQLAEGSKPADAPAWNRQITDLWNAFGPRIKADRPRPGMAKLDTYRLRYVSAGLLALTAALSPGPHIDQVKQAFDWKSPIPAVPPPPPTPPLQLKAWVTPPEGISREHLEMTEATRDHTQGGKKMSAHQSSMMTIITYGKPTEITVNGKPVTLLKEIPQGQGVNNYQYDFKLEPGEAVVKIQRGPTWQLSVDRDRPPTVSLEDIRPGAGKNDKSLDIDYKAKDDFGVMTEIVIETGEKPDPKAKPLPSAAPPVLTLP